MPRATHDRVASSLGDHFLQVARTLHVVDDIGARVSTGDVPREQHHEAVRPDDRPAVGHDAQAIGIAVEGHAHVRLVFTNGSDEIVEVRRVGRVRMVIRKAAVYICIQANYFAPKPFEKRGRHQAADAIAAVDHYLERSGEGDIAEHAVHVRFDYVNRLHDAAHSGRAFAAFDARAQAGYGVPRKHATADHHLQSVVLRRIVRSRDHDPRPGFERVGGIVEKRRRNAADNDDIATASGEARHQGLAQALGGVAPIAAHGDPAAALFERLRRECAADPVDGLGREIPVYKAANVVGAKYLRRDRYIHLRHASRHA